VCTGTSAGNCDGPGYRYDVDGQLLWDGAAGQQRMGEFFRLEASGLTAYSNIVAFGEVIAEVKQANAELFDPSGSGATARPLRRPKDPWLWMLAGAGGLAWIALLAWLGVGPAFGEAPATATLALILTTLLVVPPPALGALRRGGGGGAGGGSRGGGGAGTVTTLRAFFRDHLGSAAYVTGPNRRQVYEPFGKQILAAGVATDELTGKAYHGATDMYYFGARWYDAEAGRFAGVDPLVASPRDPQSLNAYSYVRNDPLNLIDPNGMEWDMIITGTQWGKSPTSYATSVSSFSAASMGISSPRFSIVSVGATLYTWVDSAPVGTPNSTDCCGGDQSEGGDSSQGSGTSDADVAKNNPGNFAKTGITDKDDVTATALNALMAEAIVDQMLADAVAAGRRELSTAEKIELLQKKDGMLLRKITTLANEYSRAEDRFNEMNATHPGLRGLLQYRERSALADLQKDVFNRARGLQAIRSEIGSRIVRLQSR
jgi:RHS repeat-associated protein